MSNSNNFKVGDKVRRVEYIDGTWSEMCAKHKMDIYGMNTVTYIDGLGSIGINNIASHLLGNCGEPYTFNADFFELVERNEPVIVECDSNIIAIVSKDRVVINNVAYPVKVIKDIAAALNSIQ